MGHHVIQSFCHLQSYTFRILMASLFLILLFPLLCGIGVGRSYYYPGCRNTVTAVPNLGENCTAILCSHRYRPVCGSDSEEYLNDCLLCKTSCSHRDLHKACDGFCPCGRGETTHDPGPELPLQAPSPIIAQSGFCIGKGTCP